MSDSSSPQPTVVVPPRLFALDSPDGKRVAVAHTTGDDTYRVFIGRVDDGQDPREVFTTMRADGRIGTSFKLSSEAAFMLWTCLEHLFGKDVPPQG